MRTNDQVSREFWWFEKVYRRILQCQMKICTVYINEYFRSPLPSERLLVLQNAIIRAKALDSVFFCVISFFTLTCFESLPRDLQVSLVFLHNCLQQKKVVNSTLWRLNQKYDKLVQILIGTNCYWKLLLVNFCTSITVSRWTMWTL